MLILHIVLLLGTIMVAARWGGIGVGFAGGVGLGIAVFILGIPAGDPPIDVMLIILSVIIALAVMQQAGGMNYLVNFTDRLLRNHPKYLNILAPSVTFVLTVLSGTGYTAMSVLNVIQEVAKDNGIRPSQPLSSAVVASQLAITASPISAATAIMYATVETMGVSFGSALLVIFPTALFAMLVAAFIANKQGVSLAEDPIYQERLKANLVNIRKPEDVLVKKNAKLSVGIFLLGVLFVVGMLLFKPFIKHGVSSRDLIIITMFIVSTVTIFVCKIAFKDIKETPLFKSGAESLVVVLGIVWLSSTIIGVHVPEIKDFAKEMLQEYPALLAVVFFFTSSMLFSQGATCALLMPIAASIGISPNAILAGFVAVSALYITNIYPTTAFAIATDDTGSFLSKRWNGSKVVNHPFFLPGCISILCAVPFGFVLSKLVL
ncbi:anaerobic C4-dicarboxylate transporter [Leminorella grimontii]|uniref:C4-dicarboxylate transporter n=1 Tax=Leminorella grimontii TaxID=82981 RepID=A0AAV5N7Y0_9GAMM|nr:anaerobic C4-dicarboxylate transporter [Leminorella grimontii]KFC92580.1 anaerobic C4-dicarboxylate transporter [Leminorella grimontii ATCC 33999 = DSM 5078]GKX57074.1 anaerobic C4-dicarboxylate transporter [Leminorella grimontii]VFS62473.1 Anaerobic C4-dicarboxylate transporter DcuA [Leminorella grimontii]